MYLDIFNFLKTKCITMFYETVSFCMLFFDSQKAEYATGHTV